LIVKVRAGATLEVIRDAASLEPETAGLWGRIQTEFHENQRAIVRSLLDKDALAPGLDVDSATDILWALNHPSLYWLLTHDRGWSPQRYEQWLAELFIAQLLPRTPSRDR
jgi:hypothetical protein